MRGRKYSVKFSNEQSFEHLTSAAKSVFDENDCICEMNIYPKEIKIELKKRAHCNSFLKIINSNEDFDVEDMSVQTYKKLKKNDGLQHVCFKRSNIIEQPNQLLNHVIVLKDGCFYQQEVVQHVLSSILHHMSQSSNERSHDFYYDEARTKLLEAFTEMSENLRCSCKPNCNEIMQLYGPNGISPDRQDDNIGYCEETQQIRFVVKPHNTPIKVGSIKRKPQKLAKWSVRVSHGMKGHTKERVNQLRKKSVQTESDKEQINKYDDDPRNFQTSAQHYAELLKLKKTEQDGRCSKCQKEMYFGNEDGIVEYVNCAYKASPDRIDNNNIFYEANNVRLVCCSCNSADNRRGRTYIENKPKNNPILFTKELLQQCKDWLQRTF